MTVPLDPNDPSTPGRPQPFPILSVQGRLLVEALARKSAKGQRAVEMYTEARRALARNDGPECFNVAAYELREFMNELPRALDLPVIDYEQLTARIGTFVNEWKTKASTSSCFDNGKWNGGIDGELRGLLNSATVLADWVQKQKPSRRVEAASVLQKLSSTDHPIPTAIMDLKTDEWSELLQYFNHYAHHNSDPEPADFRDHVEQLERFLLDHLEPRTFEDQDAIDRLIQETEG